jgi:hypothetical protein
MNTGNNIFDIYKECSESLRHYSEIIRNGRTLSLVQGIVIISAIVYMIQNDKFQIGLVLSIFGVLFTGVLWLQLDNHLTIFEGLLTLAVEYENKISSESDTPWSRYNAIRSENFEKFGYKLAVTKGPCLITVAIFLFLLFYCWSLIR